MNDSPSTIYTRKWKSPAGELLLGAFGDRLCLCDWTASSRHAATVDCLCRSLHATCTEGSSTVTDLAVQQLQEYFAGGRTGFHLPVEAPGTPFQLRVWKILASIPYGTTISYSQEATLLGNLPAIRAVAQANRANPVSIIVPCHRVIASDGTLGGYGGGVNAKRLLLELERGNNIAPLFG